MKTFSNLLILSMLTAAIACNAQSAAEQQDARVIDDLRSAGANLSKPHDVDFFIMLTSEAQAKAAADDMKQLGYNVVEIGPAPDKSHWELHAMRRIAPQLEAMTAITRSLEALASRYGGYYDGWGTAAVE